MCPNVTVWSEVALAACDLNSGDTAVRRGRRTETGRPGPAPGPCVQQQQQRQPRGVWRHLAAVPSELAAGNRSRRQSGRAHTRQRLPRDPRAPRPCREAPRAPAASAAPVRAAQVSTRLLPLVLLPALPVGENGSSAVRALSLPLTAQVVSSHKGLQLQGKALCPGKAAVHH